MRDFKQEFIIKCLNEYLSKTAHGMVLNAFRLKVGKSGKGVASIAHETLKSGGGAIGNLNFNEYLRFVDMGAGRKHPIGGLALTRVVLQSVNREGYAQVKDNVRKPKKIYSKIAYKNIGFLASDLSYGYTEEAIAILKQNMNYEP